MVWRLRLRRRPGGAHGRVAREVARCVPPALWDVAHGVPPAPKPFSRRRDAERDHLAQRRDAVMPPLALVWRRRPRRRMRATPALSLSHPIGVIVISHIIC